MLGSESFFGRVPNWSELRFLRVRFFFLTNDHEGPSKPMVEVDGEVNWISWTTFLDAFFHRISLCLCYTNLNFISHGFTWEKLFHPPLEEVQKLMHGFEVFLSRVIYNIKLITPFLEVKQSQWNPFIFVFLDLSGHLIGAFLHHVHSIFSRFKVMGIHEKRIKARCDFGFFPRQVGGVVEFLSYMWLFPKIGGFSWFFPPNHPC